MRGIAGSFDVRDWQLTGFFKGFRRQSLQSLHKQGLNSIFHGRAGGPDNQEASLTSCREK